jgi:hypothetical protein
MPPSGRPRRSIEDLILDLACHRSQLRVRGNEFRRQRQVGGLGGSSGLSGLPAALAPLMIRSESATDKNRVRYHCRTT